MNEVIRSAQEAMAKQQIQDLAKILAKYNLGVCIPHMHSKHTGGLVALPTGMISCERNLNVTFEEATVVEDQGMVAVAWRWNGTNMEICANCCSADTQVRMFPSREIARILKLGLSYLKRGITMCSTGRAKKRHAG